MNMWFGFCGQFHLVPSLGASFHFLFPSVHIFHSSYSLYKLDICPVKKSYLFIFPLPVYFNNWSAGWCCWMFLSKHHIILLLFIYGVKVVHSRVSLCSKTICFGKNMCVCGLQDVCVWKTAGMVNISCRGLPSTSLYEPNGLPLPLSASCGMSYVIASMPSHPADCWLNLAIPLGPHSYALLCPTMGV